MNKTPKANRYHIALFGRTNVGKSSLLNLFAGQDVAITSPFAGTTTDVVEKAMELLPVGPVVFLDTAGLDDHSLLSDLRLKKTQKVYNQADCVLLVTEPEIWTEFEEIVIKETKGLKIPVIVIINKTDLRCPSDSYIKSIKDKGAGVLLMSGIKGRDRDIYLNRLKSQLLEIVPDDWFNPPSLIGDLLPAGGLAFLVIPIDLEAPKGRLILPQVQTIRDVLDHDSGALVVKERELLSFLQIVKQPPDIVVCDSQVVLKVTADVPDHIKCTTFSILFARQKGDLITLAKGAAHIDKLKINDKILISEACSHHAIEDDIGKIKIPCWLKQYTGLNLHIDVCSGRDYPDNLEQYSLIIHCGACMLTRREMLNRIQKSQDLQIPITNYGIAISFLQGVLHRTLSPFPSALLAFEKES